MGIKQLEPAEIVCSEMGTWTHPDYVAYLDNHHSNQEWLSEDEVTELKRYFNIDTVTLWMESSINSDDWEIMMDDSDITKWDPIAPTGFFLIDINFSEDDAYAIFARNKRESEVA